MKIVVIVKEVPDTEALIPIAGGKPELGGVKWIINPYDEYAIEEAIKLAEANAGSTVTAVMVGREDSRKNLTNVLALGADDAILIKDAALDGAGPLAVAKALHAAVAPLGADVILGGRQGVDYDWGLSGIALAQYLGIAHVGLISKLTISGGSFSAESEGDDGTMLTEGSLPALFTTDKGINEPRLASLKGIMAAKKKPTVDKDLAALGLDAAALGSSGAKIVAATEPAKRQGGRIIEGDSPAAKVANLVKLLREEAKVL